MESTDPDAGRRPTADLPIGHLVRISLYWLGLTAIDGAVGVFIQNRLNYDGFVPELDQPIFQHHRDQRFGFVDQL